MTPKVFPRFFPLSTTGALFGFDQKDQSLNSNQALSNALRPRCLGAAVMTKRPKKRWVSSWCIRHPFMRKTFDQRLWRNKNLKSTGIRLFSPWDIQHSYSIEAGDQVFIHETLDFFARTTSYHKIVPFGWSPLC